MKFRIKLKINNFEGSLNSFKNECWKIAENGEVFLFQIKTMLFVRRLSRIVFVVDFDCDWLQEYFIAALWICRCENWILKFEFRINWIELNWFVLFILVFVTMQDAAFLYGIYKRRAKLMVGSVCWSLERGFFFIGIWIYFTMYASEMVKYMAKYQNAIKNINIKNVESLENGISMTIIGLFALCWLSLTAMVGALFYIAKLKYSMYRKMCQSETEVWNIDKNLTNNQQRTRTLAHIWFFLNFPTFFGRDMKK